MLFLELSNKEILLNWSTVYIIQSWFDLYWNLI